MKPTRMEPVVQLNRGAKEHVVVEVKVALRQTGDVVNPGLDVPRIEGGQRRFGHQLAVVHQGQSL